MRTVFDDTQPDDVLDDVQRAEDQASPPSPFDTDNLNDQRPVRGPLLDLEEKKAAKLVQRWIKSQRPRMSKLKARWRANTLRRSGVTGVQLIKSDKDQSAWTVWSPPGSTPLMPVPNLASRLCRRYTARMFVDPPEPDATPRDDTEEAIEAAELSTRVLSVESDAIRFSQALRRAFSLACTYGSAFVRFYIDPYAGGYRPKMARVKAGTPDGAPVDDPIDPATGKPFPGEYITTFQTADGKTTSSAEEAEQVWLPKVRREVYTGKQVLFLPEFCDGIEDARGIIIQTYLRLGELKALYPKRFRTDDMTNENDPDDATDDEGPDHQESEFTPFTPDEIKRIIEYRPDETIDLLPPAMRSKLRGNASEQYSNSPNLAGPNATVNDDAYVYTAMVWMKADNEYEKGAACVFVGDSYALDRDTWCHERQDGSTDILDLPIVQVKQFGDEDDEDLGGAYGMGLMEFLGNANELRAMAYGAQIDHIDRRINRKTFLPLNSTLSPKQLQAPGGSTIPINPGGEPVLEEIGDAPEDAVAMMENLTAEMNDDASMGGGSAAGQNPAGTTSGFHFSQEVEQANTGVSDVVENLHSAFRRGWRIMLQLIRANYQAEQIIRFVGDDNDYKFQGFTGEDLGDTIDVDIEVGSGTMMSPSAKAAVTEHLAAAHLIDAVETKRQLAANIGGIIALDDDRYEQRIRRQIGRWQEGPPKQLMDELAAEKTTPRPPAPAQMGPNGQPLPAPSPAAAQLGALAADIWDRRPADIMPEVALIRYGILMREMCTAKWTKQPPEWITFYTAEFEAMRQAAGQQTIQEQQAAAQAAQQQQTAADAEKQKVSESINFKDAPPDVQAQMVKQAGMTPTPASLVAHAAIKMAPKPSAPPAVAGATPGKPVPASGLKGPGAPVPPGVPANPASAARQPVSVTGAV